MKTVGVPPNGRSTGRALDDQEPEGLEIEKIKDVLNGKGKKAAKTGAGVEEVEDTVDGIEGLEMVDEGRPYERPWLIQLEAEEQEFLCYTDNPLELGFDEVYIDFDVLLEQEPRAWKNMQSGAEQIAEEKGYQLDYVLGDEVKWSIMSTDLETENETILYSDDYENISRIIGIREGLDNTRFLSVDEYVEMNGIDESDEEAIAREAGDSASLIYMTVSGGTAEANGLDYEPVEGCVSRLGKFSKSTDYGETLERV